MRVWVRSLDSVGWGSGIAVGYTRVGRRHGSDLVLLWLWCRPAAVALIQSLAWEPPRAAGAALKRQKKKKPHKINLPNSLQQNVKVDIPLYPGSLCCSHT